MEITSVVYRTLRGEMVKKGLVNKDLADLLGVHSTTIGNKFHNRGNCDFTIGEALQIRDTYFKEWVLEKLFKRGKS